MAGTVSPNLPIVIAATLLLLRHFQQFAQVCGAMREVQSESRIVLQQQLYVSARFAVACTVFFAAFFALPLWLFQSAILGA
ncbi:MAG TPA: hypothetical protein VFN75_03080, partial [Pseudonocardiaceae bacterium]|nr:hypothetical protein [Pseudonocardiaceae bacterium]